MYNQKERTDENAYPSKRQKIICFDPTIHAGHILTAATILFAAVGAWYNVREAVDSIKQQQMQQQTQIDKLTQAADEKSKEIYVVLGKMRDESNSWFMRLDDKLDKKMDKK